jgi:VIT1/CCC1 family predicted Fe2+/Mn2+ transporter
MAALEFGMVESERRSPYLAMAASGGLFLLGALPSVLPFAVATTTSTALIVATFGALLGLFVVGVVKAYVARGSMIVSGLENLIVAGVGGVLAWGIGYLFGTAVS